MNEYCSVDGVDKASDKSGLKGQCSGDRALLERHKIPLVVVIDLPTWRRGSYLPVASGALVNPPPPGALPLMPVATAQPTRPREERNKVCGNQG